MREPNHGIHKFLNLVDPDLHIGDKPYLSEL